MSLQCLYGFRSLSGLGTVWLSWREVAASNLLHLAMAMAMETFRYFLKSFHRPIPVRYNWSAFARKMHSTSEFAMVVLSKCVIHARFVTVAWTLRGIPCQVGEWILDLISWIYNFQPSNSFKKSETAGHFSIFTLSTVDVLSNCLTFFWMLVGCSLKPRQHFSWLLLESLTDSCSMRTPGTGHACRYGDSSFYGRWYSSNVHAIRGLTS